MYSAGAGQAALDRLSEDDPNPNSVFTRALLPRLTEPGLRLRNMVLQVRSEVRQLASRVGHNQFPAVYDQLDGKLSVHSRRDDASAGTSQKAATLAVRRNRSGRQSEDPKMKRHWRRLLPVMRQPARRLPQMRVRD